MADRYRRGAHGSKDDDDESCHTCRDLPDGSHSPALQVIGREYVNEVTSGGISGLLMMVVTVLGGIGADIPAPKIFAMGSASLAAYSFSMGFGAFVVESAKNEFATSQLEEEYQEVRERPADEVREMVCHYSKKRGLSEEDAHTVARVLSKYEDFWVQHMMAEELGIQLPRSGTAALSSGVATSVSFAVFGAIPLLGVTLSVALSRCRGALWYRPQFSTLLALGAGATVLVLLGIFLSRAVGSRTPLWNGLYMLGNGCLASVLALVMSRWCARVCCCNGQANGLANCRPDHGPPLVQPPVSGAATPAPSAPSSPTSANEAAWPTFRYCFFWGLFMLWVAVCTVVTCNQFMERLEYESLRVFAYGWLTCVTTGLGALPLTLVRADSMGEVPLAAANAAAAGMMLSASIGMLLEAHEHCGPQDWQAIVGLLIGGLFIRASERLHGDDDAEEDDVVALHKALADRQHLRKAMLIFTVMFCHSAAEGVAVGVAFSRHLRSQFGLYVSVLLAVHNIPEGLAVALVLIPRGVSAPLTVVIATLTSVPQPLLALAAFLFVDTFRWLLPLGLAFAAGAMVYVCLYELLRDAAEQMGWRRALPVAAASFIVMSMAMSALNTLTDV